MAKVDARGTGEQLNMFTSNMEPIQKAEIKNQMAQMKKVSPGKAMELKSSSVLAMTAVLHTTDMALLDACLKDAAGPEGDFFANDITVIDLSELAGETNAIDWPSMVQTFKSYRLNPVVVRNAAADMEPAILSCGLGIDVVGLARPAPVPKEPAVEEPQAPADAPAENAATAPQTPTPTVAVQPPAAAQPVLQQPVATMIIDTPVRSGSRIYAANADMVITAVVNPGAEIIADGSIHVYAPLKGRALAGAKGNVDARIFALSMEAELVSIAGIYSTFEDGPDPKLKKQPTQIRLSGNSLEIKPI